MWPQVLLDNLPRIAAGLLVPIIQFLWKLHQEQRHEDRKVQLRSKIAELSAQQEALARMPSNPMTQAALDDIGIELSTALDQLAHVAKLQVAGHIRQPKKRGFLANWFLFYAPSSFRAWCVHVLFFVTLSIVFFGLIGVATDWNNDPDDVTALIVFVVIALFALGLRTLARGLDRRRPAANISPSSGSVGTETAAADRLGDISNVATANRETRRTFWANWLLLYVPSGIWAWCVHVLFFATVLTIGFGLMGVASDWGDDPEAVYALIGLSVFALLALALRALARGLDRKRRPPVAADPDDAVAAAREIFT